MPLLLATRVTQMCDGLHAGGILLHFHNREIAALYGARRYDERLLLYIALDITRYALLCSRGPLTILPKFLFEVPYFRRYLWHIRPVSSAGLLEYASSHYDFGVEVEDKRQQYAHQQHLFPDYFSPSDVDAGLRELNTLKWRPRTGPSATRKIEDAWNTDLAAEEAGELVKIALELADSAAVVRRVVERLGRVPASLGERAFILDNVLRILNLRFTGAQRTRLNMLINAAYLRLYITALDAGIVIDTPLGAMDCGLRADPSMAGRLFSYGALRTYADAIGIRRSIEERLTWSDLVAIREDVHCRRVFLLLAAGAAGNAQARKVVEEAMGHVRGSLSTRDVALTASEVRDYIRWFCDGVEAADRGGVEPVSSDFTFASPQWMGRRRRDERARGDEETVQRQMSLPLPIIGGNVRSPRGSLTKVDVAILTIREDEFGAVLRCFPQREHLFRRRWYDVCRITRRDTGGDLVVAIARAIEQGTGTALDVTRDIIDDLDPAVIALVGIAGGVPSLDYTLGDVVVASAVEDLRVHAVLQGKETEFAAVGNRVHKGLGRMLAHLVALEDAIRAWTSVEAIGCDRPSVDLASQKVYGPTQWKAAVRKSIEIHFRAPGRTAPRVVCGSIVSSDALVKDADRAKRTKRFVRQMLAFEMEAAGVFQAAYRPDRQYPVLVVRGISDIVGLDRSEAWTKYACATAASFVHELCVSGLLMTAVVAQPVL